MTCTDDRIDDLANRMDAGFARSEQQIKELRQELKGDLSEVRTELRADIAELRSLMLRFATAMIVVLLGAILAGALGP